MQPISPHKDFRVLFVYPNVMLITLLPVGIPVLHSCLKNAGFQTKLFDTTLYKTEETTFDMKKVDLLQLRKFSYEDVGVTVKKTDMTADFVQLVNEYKPDLISFSIVQDTIGIAKQLLASISDTNIPVIAGGVFPTLCPEEAISIEGIDIICVGEGEEALLELCEGMYRKRDVKSIKNLWFKTDQGIIKNEIRRPSDINKLPYIDFDLFEKERLYRPMQGKMYAMIHIEIDRGCPYNCSYCASPRLRELYQTRTSRKYYRQKNVDRVLDEMVALVKKYSPGYIDFNSETFLARPIEDLKHFAARYKKEIGIPFWCQTRPETLNDEKVALLKDMGCKNMNIGIESGSEAFRKRVLKRTYSNEDILKGLQILDKYQIQYTLNNIIGFPDETRENIFDTIDIIRQVHPTTVNVYIFAAYRGTPLFDYCVEKGYLEPDAAVHQLIYGTELKNQPLSYQQLKGIQRAFPLYTMLPDPDFDRIRLVETFDEKGNAAFEELKKEFYEHVFKIKTP